MHPTLELLRDLIAIDSVNPGLVPGAAGERAISEFLATELRRIGADVELTEIAPGRWNVVGVIEGKTKGRTLMLCGHSDTVGVEGMDAPFTPRIDGDRIYGRGAQDMKGGCASILGAARAIVQGGGLERGSLVLAFVADEEYVSIGAEAVAKHWQADGAIVCEPTDLMIAIGHKGFQWIEVTTHGRAAHGSRPDEGRDAIVAMSPILEGIRQLEQRFIAAPPHALLGRPSVHASLISGGRELSTYPDRCTLQIERRTVDGEAHDVALRELRELAGDADTRLLFTRAPYLTPDDSNLPELIERAMPNARRGAMTYWTDAAILGHAGIPTVIFGPGGAGLHGIEEYVKASEVIACQHALVRVAEVFGT
ncbi:MAG TPA: M20/M25/M40 family metallo-hydrolase [Thermoanaerobaculia bacterium]|nr:M20/M25/M40 family metallo-hydrolase [Thermoanaerobaculia bacterium]